GAPVPEGCDAVVMQEQAEQTDEGIRFLAPVALTLTGATALRGLVARTGASSAASGNGSPDRRDKRRLRESVQGFRSLLSRR
ncbi:hypothetical protein, partial [Klebsiella pneumoniae]|uniref:hypothetical protein n=1 Tax=Klebsiella pneumoniae TaxID=573 RepID=UPI00254BA30C